MTPRSLRRAIERKAQKQARKQEAQVAAPSVVVAAASEAQVLANQKNAQLSSGPKTPAGKAISSRNALRTGLTGRTVLLPNEDAALYQQHVESFCDELKPVGDEESLLVQSLADSTWRLYRIPSLEAGIYAVGQIELKDCFAQEPDPEVRTQLIQAKIFLVYQRQLNNLSIQESRLRRQIEKDRKRLLELQETRQREARARLVAAAKAYLKAAGTGNEAAFLAEKQAIGFEFSTEQIETAARQIQESQSLSQAFSLSRAA